MKINSRPLRFGSFLLAAILSGPALVQAAAPSTPPTPIVVAGKAPPVAPTSKGAATVRLPAAGAVKAPVKALPAKANSVDKHSVVEAPISVSLADLAAERTVVPAGQPRVDSAPARHCLLTGEENADTKLISVTLRPLDNESCSGLVGLSTKATPVAVQLKDGKYAIFSLSPAGPTQEEGARAVAQSLMTDGKVITSPVPSNAGAAVATLLWSDGRRWFSSKRTSNGQLTIPARLASTLVKVGASEDVYTNFVDGVLIDGVSLANVKRGADPIPVKPVPDRDWCPAATSDGYLVCLDFYSDPLPTGKRQITVKPAGTSQVLRPNQSVRVVVLRPKNTALTLELGGVEGVYPPTDSVKIPEADEQHARHPEAPLVPDFAIEEKYFAPRLPGQANLTVTLKRAGEDTVHTVEFVVEPVYVGAVRLGVAVLFGGATDRAYGARSVGGSKQSEVVATTSQKADIELVLGYSAYLSPRGYANPDWLRFEPYAGIGVLNDSASGLQTLKSFHAGVEWEPSANFGVALTGVVRRVTRLADGLRVGSPVTGDVPTVQRADLGIGLVFNLSPEFFRVAKSSGSSFFK